MDVHQAALHITECAIGDVDGTSSRTSVYMYDTCGDQCSTKDIPGKADGKLQGYRCPGPGSFDVNTQDPMSRVGTAIPTLAAVLRPCDLAPVLS